MRNFSSGSSMLAILEQMQSQVNSNIPNHLAQSPEETMNKFQRES
jgi:hypothetical protein